MPRYLSPGTLLLILLFSVATLALAAQAPAGPQGGKPTRPAEPEEIQEIQEVTAVEATKPPTILDYIGRMHPAMVHFPLGWLALLLLVEAAALFTGREEWSKAGLFLLIGVLVSMVPAAVSGFLRASALGNDPETLELVGAHRNLNIAAGVACLLALGLRLAWRENLGTLRRRIHLALIGLATLMMLLAGHLGGKMVFGKDFLPF